MSSCEYWVILLLSASVFISKEMSPTYTQQMFTHCKQGQLCPNVWMCLSIKRDIFSDHDSNCSSFTWVALKILPNASKMAAAGQRVDTSFSSHYYSFVKSGWERRPGQVRGLCSGFPHLGFGVPCWCGVGGPRPAGRPCWSPGPCTG